MENLIPGAESPLLNKGEKRVYLVAGLGYGDEGKGTIVDYLVRQTGAKTVVRYNGGAQAAHRVVTADGREHVFAQFGSGTFVPGVNTHLSRFMFVEPFGMMREEEHLRGLGITDAFQRTTIDGFAPVITPFHIAAGRLMELSRGANRWGSCGLGIGEVAEDVINLVFRERPLCARDLLDEATLRQKLASIQNRKIEKIGQVFNQIPKSETFEENWALLTDKAMVDWLVERYQKEFLAYLRISIINGSYNNSNYLYFSMKQSSVIFEGAQGMLLDKNFGFIPNVTKTDITFQNALTLLKEAQYDGQVTKVGVLRGYFTRHGAGSLVTEDTDLTERLQDAGNKENKWQGNFRVGHFDAVCAKYALDVIKGVDILAMTNLDRMIGLPELKICKSYQTATDLFLIRNLDLLRRNGRHLTNLLKEAKPSYSQLGPILDKSGAIYYGEAMGDLLGCKKMILSFGPTAEDKITVGI